MYQGETITTTVTGFPVPIEEIADLRIVFKNNSKALLEKTLSDCTVSGESLVFRLTQADSLSLCVGKISRTAVVITKDGTRFESDPSYIICDSTVKKEVMGEQTPGSIQLIDSDDEMNLQFSSEIVPVIGGGNISSSEISVIKVLDKAEYDALETKSPTTLYLIRG